MTERVTVFEMAPRDGLQNEPVRISTKNKSRLVDLLSECGFTKIEVTSFVSPKWVPQMADAPELLASITRKPKVSYAALTPNLKGYEAARAAKADEVAIFASASEGFSQNNINCSISESLDRFTPVTTLAKNDHIPVRGYVSCVTDCPFDGPTDPYAVLRVASALLEMGCYEVSLGDTIGAATPQTTGRMLDALLREIPASRLAGHFHDTKGRALENIEVSLEKGLRTFDAAVGGLGGCPYAPGAKGNVSTNSVARFLAEKGFETGLNLAKLDEAAAFALTLRESVS